VEMEINIEKVIKNSEERMKRETPGAVATGIGVFVIVRKKDKILVRTRTEKGSLYGKNLSGKKELPGGFNHILSIIIKQKNLSGKKELPGGAVDIQDFGSEYDSAPLAAAKRELEEETGLKLLVDRLETPVMLRPAWTIIKGELIDLAFSLEVSWDMVEKTEKYEELLKNGNLAWIPTNKLKEVEFISKRMAFLVNS